MGNCCDFPPADHARSRCPSSGVAGEAVDWTTVAALTRGRVPPRQRFRLCRDAACEIIYYGSAGTVYRVDDLDVRPGFKDGGDGLVCYCFLHRRGDLARELREGGPSRIFDAIRDAVDAGDCACEVRNPSGKCCLGEVRATIRNLQRELEVTR